MTCLNLSGLHFLPIAVTLNAPVWGGSVNDPVTEWRFSWA